MARAKWTSLARDDFRDIGLYIGRHEKRPTVAEKVVREINGKCDDYVDAFAHGSVIGSAAPELGENCRHFTHKRWVIIFEPVDGGIEVLRIFDGSRDFPRLFGR